MAAKELSGIKNALAELPSATPSAARAFRQALPSLSILVYDKIVVESEYCEEHCPPEKLRIIREACEFLGGTLAAAFELGLYEPLPEEFGWYASLLKHRGFDEDHVRDTLVAWVNGIYFKIAPPASAELSRPLELLLDDLPALPAATPPEVPPPPAARRFIELILDADKRGAADYVSNLLNKRTPLEEIIDDVLLPALREVGQLWQYDCIGVAEEHAAAEVCRDVIGHPAGAVPAPKRGPSKALLCCVPGEEHELGAKFMAAFLESKGWGVYYLGRGLPAEDIARATAAQKPDVTFLAVTMISNLPAAREVAAAVREAYPAAKTILAGRAALLARGKFAGAVEAVALDIKNGYAAAEGLIR